MKYLIPFVVFVFLAACGGKESAMDADYTYFKLEDTLSIQKIRISNKGGNTVTLIRTPGEWEIEGLGITARRYLIEVTVNPAPHGSKRVYSQKWAARGFQKAICLWN